MSEELPRRPDPVLTDGARETARKLFWCGPQQIGDVPSRDGLAELQAMKWAEEVRGWFTLTIEGVAAALNRGWGREKERTNAKAGT